MQTIPADSRHDRRIESKPKADQLGWPVRDWKTATSLSHTTVYALIKSGRIDSAKFGAKRLILTSPADFLASLKQGEE